MPPFCDRCENPATVHLTEISGSTKKTERHLCEECARALGLPKASQEIKKLLASFEPAHVVTRRRRGEAKKACPQCGTTFAQFRKAGRFGCAHDYDVFESEVLSLLQRIHGSTEYTGKLPGGGGDVCGGQVVDELARAREELSAAVACEDYERAAALRDEIKKLTEEGGGGALP